MKVTELKKKQEEIRAVTCIKSNSNYFFKYAKKHSHTILHIGPLLNELGELTNDVPEMCNLLLNQYNSVFSTPCREKDITNPEEFFNVEDSNDNDILSDIIINQSVICDAINEMSSSSASGPDGLPALLFKVLEKCTKNLIGHSRLAFNNHESNVDC